MAQSKKKVFKKKLLDKYRLVVLNESTFEEKFSLKLNRLNVFVFGMLFSFILIGITYFFIAFTPLREYIPGYASTKLKRQATELTYKTDSLALALNNTNKYVESVKKVLLGEISYEELEQDSTDNFSSVDVSTINLQPIAQDYELREEVALEEKYNLFDKDNPLASEILYSPLQGDRSQSFDPSIEHYGVDIVAPLNSPVKAIADGIVVYSEWSVDTGYVIIIKHTGDMLSVYKHNQSLTKSQGQMVKAGEVIALVGNTGKITTGPHLHFELWLKGKPVDPKQYIDIQ